jgi:hypothetical protein
MSLVYHVSALVYLSCIGDIVDSRDFRRIQEESPFSFLMNMKGGVLYFSYEEETWLSERREQKPLRIRISSPVRSDF